MNTLFVYFCVAFTLLLTAWWVLFCLVKTAVNNRREAKRVAELRARTTWTTWTTWTRLCTLTDPEVRVPVAAKVNINIHNTPAGAGGNTVPARDPRIASIGPTGCAAPATDYKLFNGAGECIKQRTTFRGVPITLTRHAFEWRYATDFGTGCGYLSKLEAWVAATRLISANQRGARAKEIAGLERKRDNLTEQMRSNKVHLNGLQASLDCTNRELNRLHQY